MIKINKLRTEILTDRSADISDLYGFDFSFKEGLNIVAGQNSRGKTTINTCIYYGLGMEELLGAHNEKALDKALKEEFTIKADRTDEGESYKVLSSKILLEIENDKNKVVSLERYVKVNTPDVKTSNIHVHYCAIENMGKEDQDVMREIFFVNSRGNNDNPNGFYNWLSDFIGIALPEVSNTSRTSLRSPLYLQTIFSALFIEQTKGWSDFFATMPFFGITKAKEKIVEFILGLNELALSTRKDILNQRKNGITDDWRRKVKMFHDLEKRSNSSIIDLPQELTTDKNDIAKISAVFSTSEDEKIGYGEYLEQKLAVLRELENRPMATVRENREEALTEFNDQKDEYFKLKDYVESFENKLRIEKQQLSSLGNQLTTVEAEIRDHINLQKVFNENIINARGTNQCPTCSQEVSVDLISSKNIKIPQLTLEENTNFLRSQKKIIDSSLLSLKETIGEKESLLLYFKDSLRKKEIIIKSLSKDLIADDRAFSESEVVKKLQIEQEIDVLFELNDSITELKVELEDLANKYHNIIVRLSSLKDSEAEDESKLAVFETKYKDYLFAFGYESNAKYQITINRKDPFKYFPVYKNNKNDTIPQSIRINSSASDFVRNIWAYTLSLLENGVNHPGVIMFDEPGQHRTNLSSLKELFKVSSKITDKQTIIFTSIDKPLNNEKEEVIELNVLLEDLDDSDYKLIRLDDHHKVIQKLN